MKLFNFKIPDELHTYLKLSAKVKYMSMSAYIIKLLVEDKQRKTDELEKRLPSVR